MVVILLVSPSSQNGCDEITQQSISNHHHHHHSDNAINLNTNSTNNNYNRDNVRHVTRVNFSDVYSQVEFDENVEPVTKEGM